MGVEITHIVIITLAIIASAFFSGMEIAFVSSNRLKIELDNQKGLFYGKLLSKFIKDDNRFIAAMLLGNNIAIVIYSIWMARILEPWIIPLVSGNHVMILLLQTIISTLILLVLAEFLPKAIFQINPNRILKALAIPLTAIYTLLYPLTIFTVSLSNRLLKLFGVDVRNGIKVFSRVDLEHYVKDLNARMKSEGEMDNEIKILENAIGFSAIKARDCMIPRTDVVAMDLESSIDELKEKFIALGLSKILIYKDSIDNIIGYVHCFELFKKPKKIKEILIPIPFVPEASLAKDLLEIFTKQHGNLAVVVDEYGGTSGLVTIEDVVEEIFGDIVDEHDTEDLLEKKINDHTYLFSARQEIHYLNATYDLELEESSEFGTIGGLAIHHLEAIPEEGTTLNIEGYQLKVIDVKDNKIETIKLETPIKG